MTLFALLKHHYRIKRAQLNRKITRLVPYLRKRDSDRRWANLRRGNRIVRYVPCSVCGEPIGLPERYAGRSKNAVHADCRHS